MQSISFQDGFAVISSSQSEHFILFAVLFTFLNFYSIITFGSYLLDKLAFVEMNGHLM